MSLIPDDRPEHAAYLHSLGDILDGRLVCEITPGPRTLSHLANAVHIGLGKRPELTGAARNQTEEWRRVQSWIAGEQPRDLIVWRAQQLFRTHWERLMDLPMPANGRVWLVVHGTTTSAGQREAIRDHRMPEVLFERFQRLLKPVSRRRAASEPHLGFPKVPPDEFPLFLARCRELLSSKDFRLVETRYWGAYNEARVWARDGEATITELQRELSPFVWEQTKGAVSIDEMLVCLRGAQAALFGAATCSASTSTASRPGMPTPRARRLTSTPPVAFADSHGHISPALGAIALTTTPMPATLARLDLAPSLRMADAVDVMGGNSWSPPSPGKSCART